MSQPDRKPEDGPGLTPKGHSAPAPEGAEFIVFFMKPPVRPPEPVAP